MPVKNGHQAHDGRFGPADCSLEHPGRPGDADLLLADRDLGNDAASRLTSPSHDLAGTAYDQSFTYSYNAAGQITSRTASNDAYAWTGAVNVDRGYSVNGLNQYTASGSITPTYDARGNLTSAGGDSYRFNTKNYLVYNGSGQLFYHNPAGNLGQEATRYNLDYVGSQLTREYDTWNNNLLQRRYVYGADPNVPLVWYEGSDTGDRRWLITDERSSVIAVTNGSGAATAINTYDEYGIPGAGNQGRFQYTGQMWIPELGMYDHKARTYSPTLGRFLQTDPIRYGDGLNWYNYTHSDPVNGVDPFGLDDEDIVVHGVRPKKQEEVNQDDGGGVVITGGGGVSFGGTVGPDVVVTGIRPKPHSAIPATETANPAPIFVSPQRDLRRPGSCSGASFSVLEAAANAAYANNPVSVIPYQMVFPFSVI